MNTSGGEEKMDAGRERCRIKTQTSFAIQNVIILNSNKTLQFVQEGLDIGVV